jgi:hypothetical protein
MLHLLVAVFLPPPRWDPRMSRDVLSHWLDLMNTRGWIPR